LLAGPAVFSTVESGSAQAVEAVETERVNARSSTAGNRTMVLLLNYPIWAGRTSPPRNEIMPGFPSILAALAGEQLAGRLAISPSIVSTSSELRTAEMTAVMKAAWGVDPFDLYGVTECGMLAAECERHHGMHLFEDLAIVEVVDGDGDTVPDGETGEQILVTSLDNTTQPTIRLAVSDRVVVDPDPLVGCQCASCARSRVAQTTSSSFRGPMVGRSPCTRCTSPPSARRAKCASSRSCRKGRC
jgi:hypothetical protein